MTWWSKLTEKTVDDEQVISLREGTAEFEYFIACAELDSKDNLTHGAEHIAQLLTFDPRNEEWLELLEKYLSATDNPETLFPRTDPAYFGTEAVRAYIWNRNGETEQALDLLIQVARAKPDVPYLEAWALPWLEEKGLDAAGDQALMLLATVLNRYPKAPDCTRRHQHELARWSALAESLLKRDDSAIAAMIGTGILRKSGAFEQAEKYARVSIEATPSWHAYTALGLALRRQKRLAEATDAFEEAAKQDPSDITAFLEAGDGYFENELWEEAISAYSKVTDRDPNHAWAIPSVLYAKNRLDPESTPFQSIIDLANEGNHRAWDLWVEHADCLQPRDATANVLRQIAEQMDRAEPGADRPSIELTVSEVEAPSNRTAFDVQFRALGYDGVNLNLTTQNVGSPDPRRPVSDVSRLLWKLDGADLAPALEEPSDKALQAVSHVAKLPYRRGTLWAAASHQAAAFSVEEIDELLATMTFAPDSAEGTPALRWLPRVQTAALQIVAHIEEGWFETEGREAIRDVLFGPMDWTTSAAIEVMSKLVTECPAISFDVHQAFETLLKAKPESGYCCWEADLLHALLDLPHIFDEEVERYETQLNEME